MVFAANDMGDAMIDIINDRRHRVNHPAILAKQNRIGQAGHVIGHLPAHHVMPRHLSIIQQEPVMRPTPVRLETGLLRIGQFQRGAVINRRATR